MSITPIVVPRASEILASQLRQMIVEGQIPPGTSLPNERALVADSGLSRSSVRDALRSLEAEGLISHQGPFVVHAPVETAFPLHTIMVKGFFEQVP